MKLFDNDKNKLQLFDVTMRDGLQDLDKIYTLEEKKELFDSIIKPYIQNYELGSYPNLKFVPQMSYSSELYKYAFEKYGTSKNFYMLIFNNYGLNECIQNNINHICFITSYCETFIKKNINKSVQESIDFIQYSLKNNHFYSKVYLSTFCGSLYINYDKNKFIHMIHNLLNLGVQNITLSDTYSLLTPILFETICKDLENEKYDFSRFSLHIHKNKHFKEIIKIGLRYHILKYDISHINAGGCSMIKNCIIGPNLHIDDIQEYIT